MKRRILHLTASTGLAGAERVMLTYLELHDTARFELAVAAFVNPERAGNPFLKAVEELNVPLHRIPIGRNRLFTELNQVKHLIQSLGVDLLHTHGYRADVSGYFAGVRTSVPLVSTVHGWTPIDWRLRAYEAFDRWCLKRFDRVICVSEQLRKGLSDSGVPMKRLRMIRNAGPVLKGPPPDRAALRQAHGIGANDIVILSVGRLSEEKGMDILLSAFATCFAGNGSIRLMLVGNGPLLDVLSQSAAKLGLEDYVTFTGHVDNVRDYYGLADIFVLPSLTEGLPLALLEAMGEGIPTVCSAVGGIPEVIRDGDNGLLVPAENPEALGTALQRLVGDRNLAARLAERGMLTVSEQFSAVSWARAVEEVYDDAIAAPRTVGCP